MSASRRVTAVCWLPPCLTHFCCLTASLGAYLTFIIHWLVLKLNQSTSNIVCIRWFIEKNHRKQVVTWKVAHGSRIKGFSAAPRTARAGAGGTPPSDTHTAESMHPAPHNVCAAASRGLLQGTSCWGACSFLVLVEGWCRLSQSGGSGGGSVTVHIFGQCAKSLHSLCFRTAKRTQVWLLIQICW